LIPDKQIIERVLRGRSEDYRELMLRHQGNLYRLAYQMLGRREEAEDVLQEAFLQAFRKLAECRERSKFAGWVRRIVVNICLRRPVRELPSDELDDLSSSSKQPDDNPVLNEVLSRAGFQEIQEAVAVLPPDYRTIIALRYGEELELKEIAEILDEQPGAIYTRLHRARQMLAKKLEEAKYEMF
jgi:RNA polymerase sigma-70 factor (ECF subfamily)